MQYCSGCEEQIQFSQTSATSAGVVRSGDVLYAREQVRDGVVAGIRSVAKDYFVRILQPKADGVAVLQFAALYFFAVDEKSAPLAAIFKVKTVGFRDDSGAIARNAPVGELQMVTSFRAAANVKRGLGNAREAPCAIRGNHFQDRFAGKSNGIRHRLAPRGEL